MLKYIFQLTVQYIINYIPLTYISFKISFCICLFINYFKVIESDDWLSLFITMHKSTLYSLYFQGTSKVK